FFFPITLIASSLSNSSSTKGDVLEGGGVSSNVTLSDSSTFLDLPRIAAKELYTPSFDPPEAIYEDLNKQKRVMLADELYKFSDETLKLVRNELHYIVLNFRLGYSEAMSRRKWSTTDKRRSEFMIELIDKQMREMRIIRNLERLVGVRELEMDYRFFFSITLIASSLSNSSSTKGDVLEGGGVLSNVTLSDSSTFQDLPRISAKELYTPSFDPPEAIYEDLNKQKRVMLADELYKFSDETLKLVRNELHYRVLNFRLGYSEEMSRRKWSTTDKRRSEFMIELIDKQMRETRIIRNLERLVGVRELEMDYRLIKRTI
nr:hypothetical protein [Tanacetum cinerariifolium]